MFYPFKATGNFKDLYIFFVEHLEKFEYFINIVEWLGECLRV